MANPTIEIEQTRHIDDSSETMYCSPDCDLCFIADWNTDGSPKRIDCSKEWMVDFKPGPRCPGDGTHTLAPPGSVVVSREQIEHLLREIEATQEYQVVRDLKVILAAIGIKETI